MQSGLILSQQDIKKIIAEHFHVGEKSPLFYFSAYKKTSKK